MYIDKLNVTKALQTKKMTIKTFWKSVRLVGLALQLDYDQLRNRQGG